MSLVIFLRVLGILPFHLLLDLCLFDLRLACGLLDLRLFGLLQVAFTPRRLVFGFRVPLPRRELLCPILVVVLIFYRFLLLVRLRTGLSYPLFFRCHGLQFVEFVLAGGNFTAICDPSLATIRVVFFHSLADGNAYGLLGDIG